MKYALVSVRYAFEKDLTRWRRLKFLATGNEDNLGEVDIVICNAAVLYFGLTLELDTESLQRAFDVNVMGTLNVNSKS